MHHNSFVVSDQKASASGHCGKFVHEIEKEYLFERITAQFR
jgi:hypothetical protein